MPRHTAETSRSLDVEDLRAQANV